MNIPEFTVNLKCLFFFFFLEGPENAEYCSGDLIMCTKCGEGNDYDSVLEVAKEEGIEKVKSAAEEQLKKELKKFTTVRNSE